MAVLSGATASGKNLSCGTLTTAWQILYEAPTNNANVTSPSATAYVKEVILANTTGTSCWVTLGISASTTAGTTVAPFMCNTPINPNDSKFLTDLNTMIPAGWTLQAQVQTANSITCIISGVEIQ